MNSAAATDWAGPGDKGPRRRRFTWNRLLWSLIYPSRGHRITLTLPGVLLTVLAFGVGSAAYNSANNILFITLSLLLACLILSGVLSWLNFSGVRWRLQVAPPWRASQATVAQIELANSKRFLPTYGLWFEVSARRMDGPPAGPTTTFNASSRQVKAALAKARQDNPVTRLHLRTRLDPAGEARVEWALTPAQRGRWRVELQGVGSFFPFGFLGKSIGTDVAHEVTVWPAPVEYRRHGAGGARRQTGEERQARAGSGGDLLALRRYVAGDSHRLIHWKASARTGQLLVRQFTAEGAEGYLLWVQTDAARWPRPEQFELALSLAATLAEDLFRLGRLRAAAIGNEPMLPVRSVRDLEAWLDRLAVVGPVGEPPSELAVETKTPPERAAGNRNLMTFAPDGARGVIAILDGEKTASA
jgi:uncharacterized protein (DUF58 family)